MKNICFLAPKAPPIGGIATWFSIIKKECDKKYNVFQIDSSISMKEFLTKNKIAKVLHKVLRLHKNIKSATYIFKHNNIDVLHIATSGGNGFYRDLKIAKLAKKYNISISLHLHFGRIPEILNGNSKEKRMFLKLIKLCDSIICLDSNTYNAILPLFKNVYLINNPIQINENVECWKSKTILFIGTLNKNKGVYELLRSTKLLLQDNKTFKLKIIGPIDENEFNDIQNALNESVSEQIEYLGAMTRDDVLNHIKSARFLVLPSKTEGMPYSILESMSFGIPVLSTDVGEIKGMVADSGIVLNKDFDDNELADAMQKMLLDDEFIKMCSNRAINLLNAKHSSSVVLEQMEKAWFGGTYE